MSQDPTMLTVYVDKVDGGDIYTAIGKSVGVDRNSAKTLVLSILYGVGTKKVARDINKTEKEAKALLAAFSAKYPAVGAYRNRVLAVTRKNRPPYVATIMGRRRYLPDILASDDWLRAKAERQAFNARIQGSAADIIKLAMVRAFDMLPKDAHMILTVHDELVVLTPDTIVDEAVTALREAMEDIHVLQVPLIADIKIVQRWGEAKS